MLGMWRRRVVVQRLLIFEKKAILSDVIEWHQKEGGINNVISYVSQDLQSGHDTV